MASHCVAGMSPCAAWLVQGVKAELINRLQAAIAGETAAAEEGGNDAEPVDDQAAEGQEEQHAQVEAAPAVEEPAAADSQPADEQPATAGEEPAEGEHGAAEQHVEGTAEEEEQQQHGDGAHSQVRIVRWSTCHAWLGMSHSPH